MSVKAVTKYQADDGQEFDNIQDARAHDSMSRSMKKVRVALEGLNRGAQYGTLNTDILTAKTERLIELRNGLNSLLESRRRYVLKVS